MKQLFFFSLIILSAVACSKKAPDTPRAMVPEKIQIKTASLSVITGGTINLSVAYYNTFGDSTATPAGINWASNDIAIASVSQQGVITGIAAGQVQIKAMYNSAVSTVLITVAAASGVTATVEISPSLKELKLNESFTPSALVKDVNGNIITGRTFTWQTDNASFAAIDAGTGMITAKGYGTAKITAVADGIRSNPAMVQVIRNGTFDMMGATGTAKLKIEDAVLKLQTTSDFSVSASPPDLRIYLGNNSTDITGAVEVGTLNMRTGMQSWNIPDTTVQITGYRYVIVWCRQFGGVYGLADLGN
jgi:trimeric autotransporter adhesin